MLTRNIWVEMGLCNGSTGKVFHIIYKDGQFPPALPIAVLVKFDNYSGPSFNEISGLVPVTASIGISNTTDNMERQQLPLKLSWAITIHKSQDLTFSKAIIDLGRTEKVAGLAYVALSRVKALSDLLIEPTSHERLLAVKLSNNFIYRRKEEARIQELDKLTYDSYNLI